MPDHLNTAVQTAARRLEAAARTRRACLPVRDLLGSNDFQAAYAVQRIVNEERVRRGARVVGRKIGLTSPAVQRQLGVDRPDFGVLFADMGYPDHSTLPMARLLQPRVEAEIAFVLDADLVDGDIDLEQVRNAVGHAVAALEIVDSRISRWDISFADTVADNGSSGLFVLGSDRVPLERFVPIESFMTLRIDGAEVSAGSGRACLGDPLMALHWLAATSLAVGRPLLAGEVVLSGALGPMVAVPAGSEAVAEISGLGSVSCRFE